MKKKYFGRTTILIALTIVFLYLPMVVMTIFSFNDGRSLSLWQGFSFRWYQELFENGQMMNAVFISISVAVIATVVATILGTFTAIGLSHSKKLIKNIILEVNNLPIMNPDIVTAISLMVLFAIVGSNKGYMTMLLSHIVFCTPFVITNVLPKVNQMDSHLAEAAMDLGASPWQTLIKVIIPQIKPGILAGALLSFTISFDDFVISYFVSGNGVENISMVVYTMARRINPSIYALATIILFVVLLIVLVTNVIPMFLNKRGERNEKDF